MSDESAPLSRPLDGIVVIETSSFLTGPYGAMILSDLGADVIKVEPPGGDGFRRFGHNRDGYGATWTNANRGKRSVVIDLKAAAGVDRLKSLLATADVLVENWRPQVAGKLGLGQDVVGALNPRLVRLSITGFGDSGPLADEMAFDSLIQGWTGIIASEERDGKAAVTPFNMVDKVTGMFAAQAILAALLEREKTGVGGHVKLPMLDVVGYFNFPDMYQHRTFDGDTSSWKAPAPQVLTVSDGHVVISPVDGRQMSRTLTAIGRPEWKEDLKRMPDPSAMANEFFRLVNSAVGDKPAAHWLKVFGEAGVPVAPVSTLEDFLNNPQVEHNRVFDIVDSHVGPMRTARYPALFDGRRMSARSGPPAVGEHDAEIAPVG